MTPPKKQPSDIRLEIDNVLYSTGYFDASTAERYAEVEAVTDRIMELVTKAEVAAMTKGQISGLMTARKFKGDAFEVATKIDARLSTLNSRLAKLKHQLGEQEKSE